jgi:hypothetical protein
MHLLLIFIVLLFAAPLILYASPVIVYVVPFIVVGLILSFLADFVRAHPRAVRH